MPSQYKVQVLANNEVFFQDDDSRCTQKQRSYGIPYRFRSVPSSMLSCRHTESDLRIGPYLTTLFHVPVPLLASLVSYCLAGKHRVFAELGGRHNTDTRFS